MRHRVRGKKFGRTLGERKALYRSLVTAVLERGKIETTLAKAKAVRPVLERLIGWGKKDGLAPRRRAAAFLTTKKAVRHLFGELIPQVKNVKSGFVRIVKLGQREGDGAEMARLELIGISFKEEPKEAEKPKETKKAKEEVKKEPLPPEAKKEIKKRKRAKTN